MKPLLLVCSVLLLIGAGLWALMFTVNIPPSPSGTVSASASPAVPLQPTPQGVTEMPSPTPMSKEVAKHYVTVNFNWAKEGFGNVMVVDFVFDNGSPYDAKDLTVTCTHYAPSGTEIDRNTRTIYETIPAGTKKSIKGFNMGFIHTQAQKTRCEIDDLVM